MTFLTIFLAVYYFLRLLTSNTTHGRGSRLLVTLPWGCVFVGRLERFRLTLSSHTAHRLMGHVEVAVQIPRLCHASYTVSV